MLVATQDYSPSIDARSPFHRLDPNHGEVESPSPVSATASPTSSILLEDYHPTVRREQYRRKLVGLHHAAFCTNVGQQQQQQQQSSLSRSSSCCGQLHCLAHKRLFTHMNACLAGSECIIPGCIKARFIWAHFSACTAVDCTICSVIPFSDRKFVVQQQPGKNGPPHSPKATDTNGTTTPMRHRKAGRPPLSPKPKFPAPRSPTTGSPTFTRP